MRLVFAIAAMSLLGCGKDTGGGGGGGGMPDAPPGVNVTNVMGTISASTAWSDVINVTGPLTIAAGVTVTAMPGTVITVNGAATGISLLGTLDIEGTKAAPVTVGPSVTGGHWNGFAIGDGGQLITHYMVGNGGGVHLSGTAKATMFDTQVSRDSHDLLTMNGGTVDVEYSWIGLEPPMADTTHCAMHMAGTNTIKVTHTNLSTSVYGIMFYGGVNADFTYDNWFSNSIDIDATPGVVTGDFSNGWFQKGTPAPVTGLTMNNMSSTRLTDAGPR